jgi:hypothetical protein
MMDEKPDCEEDDLGREEMGREDEPAADEGLDVEGPGVVEGELVVEEVAEDRSKSSGQSEAMQGTVMHHDMSSLVLFAADPLSPFVFFLLGASDSASDAFRFLPSSTASFHTLTIDLASAPTSLKHAIVHDKLSRVSFDVRCRDYDRCDRHK